MRRFTKPKENTFLGFGAGITDDLDVSAERKYKDLADAIKHPNVIIYDPKKDKKRNPGRGQKK